MKNTALKVAVIESGVRSYELERQVGMWPSKLSRIINGMTEATDKEKAALAQKLGKSVREIFPESEQVLG